MILIGHVTKDGSLAGPKSLEHLVDAVVSIEGERGGMRRILRATKNRFGPVDELALYEMTGRGALGDRRTRRRRCSPSGARDSPAAPSRRRARVLRCLLVEVQALVGPAASGSPRRVAIGLDGSRLALLLAVLEGAGLALSTREVFVSCTGGLEVGEPAADLAVVAALVSSSRGQALPESTVFFGEIGLLGEVRRVPAAEARLKEAAALGFSAALPPGGQRGRCGPLPGSHRDADRPRLRLPARGVPSFGRGVAEGFPLGLSQRRRG